jgi:tetratricopeptide (TPR) repeat protein
LPRPLAALAILIAVLASYATSFDGAFVFDDIPAIVDNPHVRGLLPLRQSFSAPSEVTTAGRPVAAFSFAVSYALAGGYETWMFHATNIAIHLAAALVLFGVVRRTLLTAPLSSRFGRASSTLGLIIALLWAVHPLQTQAVTYLVQRVESLMGLFLLLTIYCAIRADDLRLKAPNFRPKAQNVRPKAEATGAPSTSSRGFRLQAEAWIALAVVFCALGMGTKQTMVGAPLLVVLWDWLFAGDRGARALLARRWALYAGLAATWLLLAYFVASEPRPHSVGSIDGWTPLRYLVTQPGVILHYLRLAVWPHPLVFDYDWPAAHGAAAVVSVAVVAALSLATIVGVLRRIPAAFAGAWFFVILAPTSSVLPIATEVAAEHRMYLPLAAVIAVVVAGAYLRVPKLMPAIAMLIVVAFGVQTAARNRDYVSDEQIWVDTIAKQPQNARARNNYAVDLLQAGQPVDAAAQAREAIALKPSTAEAHKTLGVALLSTGHPDEGIAELQRAIQLDPDDGSAYRNLGEAFGAAGDLASAARAFTQAARYLPDDPFVLNRAGWLLATAPDAAVRNGAEALALAQRAVDLTHRRDVTSLDTLAAAHAERAEFDAAIAAASEALALAPTTGQTAMVPELEQRLALYRARQPMRSQ